MTTNKTCFLPLILCGSVAFGAPANPPKVTTKRFRTNGELIAAGQPDWATATGVTCNSVVDRNPDPNNQYSKTQFPLYLPDVSDWPTSSPAPSSVVDFTDDEKAVIRAAINFWNNSGASIEMSLAEGAQWATDFGPNAIYDYNGALLKIEGPITTVGGTALWGVPELDALGVQKLGALGITSTRRYNSNACVVGMASSYILFNFFQPTLIDWDVRMNGIYGLAGASQQVDFWETATHEIGHVMGLQHDNTISSFVDQSVEGKQLSDWLLLAYSHEVLVNGTRVNWRVNSEHNVYGSNWIAGAKPADPYIANTHILPPANPLDRILSLKADGTLWGLNYGEQSILPPGFTTTKEYVYFWEQITAGGSVSQAGIDAAKAKLSNRRFVSIMSTGAGASAAEALTRSNSPALWGSELFGDDCLLLPASGGGCFDPINLVRYPSYDQLKALYGEYPVTNPPTPRAKKNGRTK